MRLSRRQSIAAAMLLAAGLAGASPARAAEPQETRVAVRQSGEVGGHLVDGDGRALYLFTADTRGTAERAPSSACDGACATAWPPLVVQAPPAAGEGVRAELLSTFERADGGLQVAYGGWPLYRWVGDKGRGAATGQDLETFGGEWYLVTPGGRKAQALRRETRGDAGDGLFAGVRFSKPECVRYDRARGRYLVSNINGGMTEADSNGFITLLDPESGLVERQWILSGRDGVDLHAPKGMAIAGDRLYVADIDHLRSFDAETGAPLESVHLEGARFLNDVAVAADGTVFVTDSGTKDVPGAIYRLAPGGSASRIVGGRELHRPNGIALDARGRLVVATFAADEVMTISRDGEILQRRHLPTGKLDGLEIGEDGSLYVSSWTGKSVFRLRPDGGSQRVLTNVKSPAAFELDHERGRLLVPLPRANKVVVAPLD